MYYIDVVEFNDEQQRITDTLSRDAAKGWRFRHTRLRVLRLALRGAAAAVERIKRTFGPKVPPARPNREQLSYH